MSPRILGFITTYYSIANISNLCTCSPRGPGDATQIKLADTQGALVVMTIVNAVIVPIVNVVILY